MYIQNLYIKHSKYDTSEKIDVQFKPHVM